MANQEITSSITDPPSEEWWIIRRENFEDLKSSVNSLKNENHFWHSLRWCLAGGFISILATVGGYHMFDDSPDAKALIIGYLISFFCLITSLLLFFRENKDDHFKFYKEQSIKILNRIEGYNLKRYNITDFKTKESDLFETKRSNRIENLFTDIKSIRNSMED